MKRPNLSFAIELLSLAFFFLVIVSRTCSGSSYRAYPNYLRPPSAYKVNAYPKLNRYQPKSSKPIKVPVHTRHQLTLRDYPSTYSKQGYTPGHEYSSLQLPPQVVEVMARSIPLSLIFRSSSSRINIKQVHQPSRYQHHRQQKNKSYSVDKPHYLKHTVKKPVYQYVHESIVPYRKVTQEIRPVQEEIYTHLATSGTVGKLYGEPNIGTQYQVEPVLYVSPDDIKPKPELKLNEGHVDVQLKPDDGAILSYPAVSPVTLPNVQSQSVELKPVEEVYFTTVPEKLVPHPLVEANGHGQVEVPKQNAQIVQVELASPPAIVSPQEPVPSSVPYEPASVVAGAPLVPVTNAMLDTYVRYSQLNAEDILIPVFQQTSEAIVEHAAKGVILTESTDKNTSY